MKTKTLAIFIGILFFTGCQNLKEVDTTVYMDPIRPVEERVEALLEQMTLEEKIGQMDMVSEWDQDSIMKAGYYDFGAWIAEQAARKVSAEIRSAGNQSQALEKSINARRSVEDIRLKTTVRVLQTE